MSQHHQYINVVAYYLKKNSFFKEFLMDMFSRQYVRWREFSVEDVSTEHSIDWGNVKSMSTESTRMIYSAGLYILSSNSSEHFRARFSY